MCCGGRVKTGMLTSGASIYSHGAGRDRYVACARLTWRQECCSSAVRLGTDLEELVEMRQGKVGSLELEEGSSQTYIGHNTNIPRPILGGVMDFVTRVAQIPVKRLLPKNLSPRAPVPNQSYYGFQTTSNKTSYPSKTI